MTTNDVYTPRQWTVRRALIHRFGYPPELAEAVVDDTY